MYRAGINYETLTYSIPLIAIAFSLVFFIIGTIFGLYISKKLAKRKSRVTSNTETVYEEVRAATQLTAVPATLSPDMTENLSYVGVVSTHN